MGNCLLLAKETLKLALSARGVAQESLQYVKSLSLEDLEGHTCASYCLRCALHPSPSYNSSDICSLRPWVNPPVVHTSPPTVFLALFTNFFAMPAGLL